MSDIDVAIGRENTGDLGIVETEQHQPGAVDIVEDVANGTPLEAAPFFLCVSATEKQDHKARVTLIEFRQVDVKVTDREFLVEPGVVEDSLPTIGTQAVRHCFGDSFHARAVFAGK